MLVASSGQRVERAGLSGTGAHLVCVSAAVVRKLGQLYGVCAVVHQECRNWKVQTGNFSCCCLLVCRTFTEERKLKIFENRVLREVGCVWNVMAHAQKPDFVFRRNGRVHLNRRGRQFSRLVAAEVCASAVIMLDTPCSEVEWRVLATHSIRQFPPSLPHPCVTVCHHISTWLWDVRGREPQDTREVQI